MLPINQQQAQQPPPATTRKSVTGFVTKLVGDGATYGFINDEIFFQQTSVVGSGPAAVNDRVFAECEYSAHLPIKWNATSVKIISKAAGQQQQSQPSAILESDPRRQSRQSSFNQAQPSQQQPPPPPTQSQQPQQAPPSISLQAPPAFNQSPNASVAITYQQHRQQRQIHRQSLDPTNQQHDGVGGGGINDVHQDQHQPRLLDQANNQGETFYGMANLPPPPFVSQQQPGEMQPFQDTPMGPPKLAYTSQLGSAFVQNPMMANSFMPQHPPPPSMLQQQQPPPALSQQPQLHHQQQQNNQQQQTQNHHNKGARFNNQQDKSDRQNLRRNQRTDGRNDQNSRSVDRDRDQQSHNNNNNINRSSRQSDSRDRSANRSNVKRDETPSRPSPPARSTASVSSDRTNRSRRHYETKNIPKSRLLIDLNGWNMRHRCSSSIHVPSDLKSVIVNPHFRLDIKNTPKPIQFKIEQAEQQSKQALAEETSAQENNTTNATETTNINATKGEQTVADDSEVSQDKTEADTESISSSSTIKAKKDDTQTPPSSKSDIRLNHKYGVKVILISMPELETIYKKVFGENLDSFNSDSKSHQKLDEIISLLCNKGANGGFSLIGGKFDPVLDGFVEGETNEFERHGRQPDLIATCKRVVLDQANLDLGSCRSWTHISTLMYNNKSDYFSPKASIEYSYIYMPQIWTMSAEKFDKQIIEKQTVEIEQESSDTTQQATAETSAPTEPVEAAKMDTIESEQPTAEAPQADAPVGAEPAPLTLENLAELKIVDLKLELDRRDIKYKPNAKKAELVALLQEILAPSGDKPSAGVEDQSEAIAGDEKEPPEEDKSEGQAQLEEGEVAGSPEDEQASGDQTDAGPAAVQIGKRKESEVDSSDQESNKKIRTGSEEKAKVEKKVELIREPFVVKSREGLQQLSLVSLYDAAQVGRYDQFELSVASGLLREALIQHLSEYIFTALIEHRQKQTGSGVSEPTSGSGGGSSLSGNGSQDTSSDSNNNTNKGANQQILTSTSSLDKTSLKELPVDRYVNLAFAYFDASHTGQIQVDDMSKLFNNTGLTISKRALTSLVGDGDKFNYRTLPDLCPMLASYIYKFPEQFNRLPGSCPSSTTTGQTATGKMIQFQGVSYDVEKLIQQVKDAETLRISLVDRFNYAILNHDKQTEEIHVLEVSQKSLSRAIKAQNDEICELKRERDSMKKKLDNLKRAIKAPINSLSDLLKEDKT